MTTLMLMLMINFQSRFRNLFFICKCIHNRVHVRIRSRSVQLCLCALRFIAWHAITNLYTQLKLLIEALWILILCDTLLFMLIQDFHNNFVNKENIHSSREKVSLTKTLFTM
uniref:Uncharacterized protein n=1 Tax=Glossina brevipalpis TaxID=37001 RepID=A0A1A9W1V3_9MUSC